MDSHSPFKRFSARVTGPLYAFLYRTNQRRFLGFTVGGWLKNLPFLFALLALVMPWPAIWVVFGIVLAILIRILYWGAKKAGYIHFLGVGDQAGPAHAQILGDDVKVPACATGRFSVKDWEEYVLERPADYWRIPIGDHAFMVEHQPGRYLYEFIQRGALEKVESGFLFFGRQPKPALAITFLSTWGTGTEEVNFQFYAPSQNNSPGKFRRKIYLTFKKEADKNAVWRSLLRDAGQPITKKAYPK
jgi:hypothetical protein